MNPSDLLVITAVLVVLWKARILQPKRVVWRKRQRRKSKPEQVARILVKIQFQQEKVRRKIERDRMLGVYNLPDISRLLKLQGRIKALAQKYLSI